MNYHAAKAPATDPRIGYFDELAPRWDAEGPDPAGTIRRLEELRTRLGLPAGADLLELGCGTGQITGWLAARVRPGRVVAADFSPAMLRQARGRGGADEYWDLDICAPPPAARRFGVIFCFHAYPHFRDQKAALRHCALMLEPRGLLIILHLSGSAALNAFHHRLNGPVNHDFLPEAGAWDGLLREAGLALEWLEDRDDLFLLKARRSEKPANAGD